MWTLQSFWQVSSVTASASVLGVDIDVEAELTLREATDGGTDRVGAIASIQMTNVPMTHEKLIKRATTLRLADACS